MACSGALPLPCHKQLQSLSSHGCSHIQPLGLMLTAKRSPISLAPGCRLHYLPCKRADKTGKSTKGSQSDRERGSLCLLPSPPSQGNAEQQGLGTEPTHYTQMMGGSCKCWGRQDWNMK